MKNIALKYIATSLMLACAVSAAAQQTKILTADKHNEYGLVYTLPVTALRIEVTAERNVYRSGPFFQYAKKYIGTDKVIKEDHESWAITDVRVTSYGIPDSDNRYLMQLKTGATTFIAVADDGMLRAINARPEEKTSTDNSRNHKSSVKTESGTKLNIKDYLQYVNEDFIASQSSAKQAQILAENLMEIRDARISLTRGTAETMPTDGRQLELMLNSLSNQEKALTAAFTGTIETSVETRVFTFTPETDGKTILFRMSDFAGFVEADNYAGDPVYLFVKITNEGTLPVDAKGETKKLPKDAVIYNIPGAARITLSHLGKELYSGEREFSQFGVSFGLNPQLFSAKKERSFAIFDPATGALKEIGQDNSGE